MNILIVLAFNFLIIGLISIGGINATLPEIHRIIVENLHLISEAKFTEIYAFAQAAPGPNLLIVGLFGFEIAGVIGAVITTSAIIIPTFFIAIYFDKFGSKYQHTKNYQLFKMTLIPIASGLLFASVFLLARSIYNWKIIIFILINLIIISQFKVKSIYLILAGALIRALGILH